MKGKPDLYDDYSSPLSFDARKTQNDDECAMNFNARMQKLTQSFESTEVGDKLTIRLKGEDILACYNNDDVICGYLNSVENHKIISCLKKLRKFQLEILDKLGAVRVFSN